MTLSSVDWGSGERHVQRMPESGRRDLLTSAHSKRTALFHNAKSIASHAPWASIFRRRSSMLSAATATLETAVGHARVRCDGARWQGATTRWAHAHKEEQRSQCAPGLRNRVCSAVASVQNIDVGIKTICDKMLRADSSGLLPFLGLQAHGQNPSIAARFVQRVVEIPRFGQH